MKKSLNRCDSKINVVEEELRQLGPWHFLVELEGGIFTIPSDQWKTHWHTIVTQDYMTRILFPLIDILNKNNPSDTTVIDIGCNEGWLSLLLHRMGFKRVVGVDANEANIKKANFLKEHFKMDNVEFQKADINDFRTNEKFDFSIMLGVINHTHNPVGILRNIHSFTDKYLILDFDSFCEDYNETSKEAKFDTDVSSVFGNMHCHFEPSHQTTSTEDENLVFQYSRRAMQLMMNYTGFDNIFHAPPRIFAPSHYKNDKRVMLIGRKLSNKQICNYELAIDKEYMESKTYMDCSQPRLEADYRKYNIVSYGGKYYGIPQGEMQEFDIVNVISNIKNIFGDSINSVKKIIDKCLNTDNGTVDISGNNDFERDEIRYRVGCELLLQSKLKEAKEIFEDLIKRHSNPVTELTANIFYQMARIARRMGNNPEAKNYLDYCISLDPTHKYSFKMLWEMNNNVAAVGCHKLFY